MLADGWSNNICDQQRVERKVCTRQLVTALQEATRALIPVLGKYYMRDERNVVRALWEDRQACRWVSPDKDTPSSGVMWFRPFSKSSKSE